VIGRSDVGTERRATMLYWERGRAPDAPGGREDDGDL
jgi:hypothetical protein